MLKWASWRTDVSYVHLSVVNEEKQHKYSIFTVIFRHARFDLLCLLKSQSSVAFSVAMD